MIFGVGLGGFVDGIVLHQVLQWHHLLSSTGADNVGITAYPVTTLDGLGMNTLWDGLFHVVTWVAVLTGLALLYSRVTDSRGRLWRSQALWGWALVGWGLFNLVEGSRPPPARHPPRPQRTEPALVGSRLPRARRAAGRRRLGWPRNAGPVNSPPTRAATRARPAADAVPRRPGALGPRAGPAGRPRRCAARARRTGPGWQARAHGRFGAGAGLLADALAARPRLPGHMRQHLLIGMLAPLGLVLGAP